MALSSIYEDLAVALDDLSFHSPVAYVYNPLIYAAAPHRRYVERFADAGARVLMVGMNPGPWGMAQTGIPFGAVKPVTQWLGFGSEPIGQPPEQHPKRLVEGFACQRNEVSGQRLWGWAEQMFGTPEAFFSRFFIGNYCPLLFLEASGRNLTPDKLRAADREPMLALCDEALRHQVEALQASRVIAFGVWAEKQVRSALASLDVRVDRILHPSPASPLANRGWAEQATAQLRDLGIVD